MKIKNFDEERGFCQRVGNFTKSGEFYKEWGILQRVGNFTKSGEFYKERDFEKEKGF